MTQNADLLLGALVADASCLGLHWIYDVDRVAEVTARQNGQCAFTPIEARNFEGVKTFAHKDRQDGMFTQIGEVLHLAIRSMNDNGGTFDVAAYQAAFAKFFGAGGAYNGFMDRPTQGALANIAAEQNPSGIDDNQTPALSRLPAILVGYQGQDNLADMIKASLEVTNINAEATTFTNVFADLCTRIMNGEDLNDALHAAANAADETAKAELLNALNTAEDDSVVFAGINGLMGRACYLSAAGPVIFHILARSKSYQEAIERNILAAGDTAGRSIMIGAIMARVHGVATPTGVPLSWVLKLKDGEQVWNDCQTLASAQA
ncbi:MAG: ADP-ribosylglycohydrolase family protein [Litoreibacter sp.]|uniref:ADP-ribosylglycohydrolase family protein n=1 Tax=Litoreibacter sp. TaxID=1969459 RepID=UPI00329A37F3